MTYDKYKYTRIEWFNDIPSHWNVVPLKRMLMGLQDGTHGTYQNADSEHFLLSAKNIMEDGIHIGIGDRTISEEDYKEIIANGFPQKGDILLCCVGTIGRCCIFEEEEPIAFQRSVSFLRTNNRNYNKFILYLLNSQAAKIQYDLFAKTSAQSGLYMGDLCKLLFPCPPIAEQIAIAEYLDKKCEDINKSIDIEKRRIELLSELKQTIITNAVTRGLNPDAPMKDSGAEWIGKIPKHWDMVKIKFNFNIYAGATPKTEVQNYWDGDIVWITPADYKTKDKYVSCGQRHISKDGYNSCNTQIVPKGSLIFSKRAPIGTVALADTELCTNQGCLSCVPRKCSSLYYYYVTSVYTEIFDLLGSGATFKEISANDFANIKLPSPTYEEQLAIVSSIEKEVSKIDKQISITNQHIELLNELKQSIITEAVTGKIKVC